MTIVNRMDGAELEQRLLDQISARCEGIAARTELSVQELALIVIALELGSIRHRLESIANARRGKRPL